MNCPRCGEDNPARARFCLACAAPLAARPAPPGVLEGERKRVSVLFADIENSTALLLDRDPEEGRLLLDGLLERMMEAVHLFEGTVNQTLGDGIMALFGAPVAHEDHALRACHAALRMRDDIQRYAAELEASAGVSLRLRIGINAGEVVVRSIANDLHLDYTAVGETTHLAAKLEQMAEPGTIYATAALARLVEGYVQLAPRGPREVKGLNRPLEVFEVTGLGPLRTRFQASMRRGLSRFVGREAEIAQLNAAIGRAGAGEGQVVALIGEPGVGKSRLLWEFTRRQRHRGWSVLEAGAAAIGTVAPYAPLTGLLGGLFRVAPADSHAQIGGKIRAALHERDPALAPCLPALLALFDVPDADPRWRSLDPAQRHRRTIEAVARVLKRESQARPLIVAIEDFHGVDAQTQEVLDALAKGLAGVRLLLIVEHRPEYQHAWEGARAYLPLRVEALPQASAGELFRSLLRGTPGLVQLEREVLARTEGNPFFIEETVRGLIDGGVLESSAQGYRLTRPLEAVAMPATVQDILAARLDRMPGPEKDLLQLAAVIGKEFPLPVLQRVTGSAEAELSSALAALMGGGFLAESTLPALEYSFKHAYTHQVAYTRLLQSKRKLLHARTLEAIEALHAGRLDEHAVRLAHHAVRGEQWEQAVRYLAAAARRAAERSANADAVRHLEEAIRILPHLPKSPHSARLAIDLRLALRNPLLALGAFARILPVLREAEALAETHRDDARRSQVAAYIAGYFWLAGQHEAAVEAGRCALEQAEGGDPAVLVAARFYVGASLHGMAEYRQALAVQQANLDALEGAPGAERLGMAGLPAVLSRCMRVWSHSELGEFAAALTEAAEARRVAEASGDAFSILTASFVTAVAHLARGDLADAMRILEQGLALCRAERMRMWFPAFAMLLAQATALAGRAMEAAAMIEKAQPVRSDAIYFAPFAVVAASEVLLLAGNVEAAASQGARALDLAKKKRERGYEAWTMRLLGEIAASREPTDVQVAEAYYCESLSRARDLGMRPLAARCLLGLGLLYARGGLPDKARGALAEAEALFEEMGMRHWLARARAAKPGASEAA